MWYIATILQQHQPTPEKFNSNTKKTQLPPRRIKCIIQLAAGVVATPSSSQQQQTEKYIQFFFFFCSCLSQPLSFNHIHIYTYILFLKIYLKKIILYNSQQQQKKVRVYFNTQKQKSY